MPAKPNTGVIITGRRIASYREAGVPLPVGHIVHRCATCFAHTLISPEGQARMKATVAAMSDGANAILAIVLCGQCLLKATLPASTTIIPTARGLAQIAESAEARDFLSQIEGRKKGKTV